MLLVDANILLYAVNQAAPQHSEALQWLDEKLSGDEPIGFAWFSLVAFLRISTLASLFPKPLSPAVAKQKVDAWLGESPVRILNPTEDHWTELGKLLSKYQATGNLISDIHLTALAIEHGATICSTDRDFQRFSEITWLNPLAADE